MRELTGEELDLVSGGRIYQYSIGGFTFTYNDATRETTVGAGGISVTTGPCDPSGHPTGRCNHLGLSFIATSSCPGIER
jgi:hypothetical protein